MTKSPRNKTPMTIRARPKSPTARKMSAGSAKSTKSNKTSEGGRSPKMSKSPKSAKSDKSNKKSSQSPMKKKSTMGAAASPGGRKKSSATSRSPSKSKSPSRKSNKSSSPISRKGSISPMKSGNSNAKMSQKKGTSASSSTKDHHYEGYEKEGYVEDLDLIELESDNNTGSGNASSSVRAHEASGAVHKHKDGDVLDDLIDTITIPGLFAGIALLITVGILIFGMPTYLNLHICAIVLGMGRGGVPGCATVAAAFFVLLAPDGYVKEMLALMTIAESIPNCLVGYAYRASADWNLAFKLNMFTTVGLACGSFITEYLSDIVIRQVAGLILFSVMGQMTFEKVKKYRNTLEMKGKKPTQAELMLSELEDKERKTMLKGYYCMVPLGIVGGILSYVAGNMGPLLNVYLVLLALPKYEMVGTRAAIFIPVDAVKLVGKYLTGHLLIPNMGYDLIYIFNYSLDITGISDITGLEINSNLLGEPYKYHPGSDDYSVYYGLRLGIMGIVGVLIAKVWLRLASKEFFQFIYERVTYIMTGLMGSLLVTGMSIGDLIKIIGNFFNEYIGDFSNFGSIADLQGLSDQIILFFNGIIEQVVGVVTTETATTTFVRRVVKVATATPGAPKDVMDEL